MYGRQQRRTGGRRRLGQALAAMANANGNGVVNAANATPFGNAGMMNAGNNVNSNPMANGMQNANARRQASQSINELSQTVQDPNTQFVEGGEYFDNAMQVSTGATG